MQNSNVQPQNKNKNCRIILLPLPSDTLSERVRILLHSWFHCCCGVCAAHMVQCQIELHADSSSSISVYGVFTPHVVQSVVPKHQSGLTG